MIKNKKIVLIRIILILLCAFVMNLLTMTISKTYSWFIENKTVKVVGATVDKTSDIVDIRLTNDAGEVASVNPTKIEFTRKKAEAIDPIIYFQVEGELSNYMLQINPVEINKDKIIANMITTVNKAQYDKLIEVVHSDNAANKESQLISGKLRIRYLNGYIDEVREVKYSADFLIGRFNVSINR